MLLLISNTVLVVKVVQLNNDLKDVYQNFDMQKRNASPLVFDSQSYDFGKIVLDSNYQTNFTFTNTGTKPIKIKDIAPSCGCTVPVWNKGFIDVGHKGSIALKYHAGPVGNFSKETFVYVVGETKPIVLTIKGSVKAR